MPETATEKARFTPGPWKVVDTSNRSSFSKGWREIHTVGTGRGFVVSCGEYQSSIDGTICGVRISEANASLIAAAPEMYIALRMCIDALEAVRRDTGDEYRALEHAKQAFAKAEGRALKPGARDGDYA